MATVLKITIGNSTGDERSINLPNPLNDLTLTSIRNSLNTYLSQNILSNKTGNEFYTSIKSAKIITTTERSL